METAGPQYSTLFEADEGMSGSEKAEFLSSLGMQAEAPQNYSVAGWLGLLRADGPLWVTTNEGIGQNFAIHARIIRAIVGDGTPMATFFTIVDPANGNETGESVSTFTEKFEDVARIDHGMGADLRPQVVHF